MGCTQGTPSKEEKEQMEAARTKHILEQEEERIRQVKERREALEKEKLRRAAEEKAMKDDLLQGGEEAAARIQAEKDKEWLAEKAEQRAKAKEAKSREVKREPTPSISLSDNEAGAGGEGAPDLA